MPVCRKCQKTFDGPYRNKYCSTVCQFEFKALKVEGSDCVEWQGAIGGHGYGVVNIGGEIKTTHRLSYELHKGPIPDGAHILHRCDNRRCVNIEHLFAGTHHDNMLDMAAKGRAGNQGKRRPIEHAEKSAEARRKVGYKNSDQQRLKAGETMRALWQTPEHRAKMSVSGPAHKDFGKKISEEHRIKMRPYWDSLIGTKRGPISESTREKQRAAALIREANKRILKE